LTGIAAGLELDDDVAEPLDVKEPQVDAQVVPVDVAMHLSSDEREPLRSVGRRAIAR
jgi:hypothetical protein